MPISINGRTYMNLQEAVAWLLANNALTFQCRVNFVADTEISKTDIINPAPADLKVGSLVLFADGIVGTVNGITANGFKVGSESTDLSDGVPHITGISIDASQHLIFTMSEGDPINAGLIETVSSFSIDASQHLIANYNDGTTQDLGPIFQGNVNISGNLTADSIVENMTGYSFNTPTNSMFSNIYASIVKNGNKLTCVWALDLTYDQANFPPGTTVGLGSYIIPNAIGAKLYPSSVGGGDKLAMNVLQAFSSPYTSPVSISAWVAKGSNAQFYAALNVPSGLVDGTKYYLRYEATFLLSDNMAI